jgi:hypothetical protein
MSEDFIRVDAKKGNLFDIIGSMGDGAVRALKDTIEDIADEIEELARINAPEGPTGELKAHPVERRDLKRRVRGPGGLVVKSELSVPDKPEHAKWVHDGTGIFGPRKRPITPRTAPFMVFEYQGRIHRRKTVQGQRPQPYLREAVEEAERTLIPIKLAELRARLELLD